MHVFPQNTLLTKRHCVILHTTPVLVTPPLIRQYLISTKNLLQLFNLQELQGQSGEEGQD
jgi:hypothetical protein